MCTENFTRSRWWNSCIHRVRWISDEVWFSQDACLAILSRQSWLASFLLLFLKVSSLKNKTFKNFSRLFHCSVINVLKLFYYLLTGATLISYHVVLGLSRVFFNFFIFLFLILNNTEKEGFEPSRRFNTTYTLSRGASSASWVFLLNYFKSIFCLRLTAHFLLYSCVL